MDLTNPAYGTKSTIELLCAITVFYACQIPFIVKYSETLLNLSTKIVGQRITDALLKMTILAAIRHIYDLLHPSLHLFRRGVAVSGREGVEIWSFCRRQDDEGSNDSSRSGCIFGHLAMVHLTGAVDSYGFIRVNDGLVW
jgi:hypothetical protein